MVTKLVIVASFLLINQALAQQQEIGPVQYAVEGEEVNLPCTYPSSNGILYWKFHRNGTTFDDDAASIFPGYIVSIFPPFNSPSGRSKTDNGNFIITSIKHDEEGEFWCELNAVNVPTTKSRKTPVHVYVRPQTPKLAALTNRTLTENKGTPVARCTSQGGKPASQLTWMNGTIPMTGSNTVVTVNTFKSYLNDSDRDLVIKSPTRYDHNRIFSCKIEHPSYVEPKILNYSVLVMHHPYNIRVWANVTSKMVYCEAESYPAPTYHWTMPGSLTGFTGPSLFIADLFDLPGGGRFECTAENGIPSNVTVRMTVDELRYPDGKPGLAGLEWWIWAAIGGAALLVVIITIVVCCIKCRKSDKGETVVKYKSNIKKPLTESVTPQHPSSLPLNRDYRGSREDSFDSRTPSPVNEHKRRLLDGSMHQEVALVPNDRLHRSREQLFDHHASREQLDMVASHISTLNKSWDQLSKSRQALNEAQDELQHMNSNLNKSREQLYHSREALNRDDHDYPYIDDDSESQHYQHRQAPPAYDYDTYQQDNREHGTYADGPQYDARYDTGHEYSQDRDDYRYGSGYYDDREYYAQDYDPHRRII